MDVLAGETEVGGAGWGDVPKLNVTRAGEELDALAKLTLETRTVLRSTGPGSLRTNEGNMENIPLSNTSTGVHVEGFPDATKAAKITGPLARQLADMTLHKDDLDRALACLDEINRTDSEVCRSALFEAAVVALGKCFSSATSRSSLDPKKVYGKSAPEALTHFEFFKNLRNRHVVHDENDYSQCHIAAAINDGSKTYKVEKILSLSMRVVSLDQPNYNNLHLLLTEAREYVVRKHDELSRLITDDLEKKTIAELQALPDTKYQFMGPAAAGKQRPHT